MLKCKRHMSDSGSLDFHHFPDILNQSPIPLRIPTVLKPDMVPF